MLENLGPFYLPTHQAPPPRDYEPPDLSNSLLVTGSSDIGRIRQRNEDSFALAPEHGVAVVADGMGGHPGGDVASRIAVDVTHELLRTTVESSGGDFVSRVQPAMEHAVITAHESIRAHAKGEPDLYRMGTTLTAIVADRETGAFVVGHVGDSRAYLFRAGVLSQITRDDTWVQQQIENKVMDPDQARRSSYAHLLTQCLGLDEAPHPQVFSGQSAPGDTYLLCTDGLVGMLQDKELAAILSENFRSAETAEDQCAKALTTMLEAANEAGGRDNITAALVRFG